MVQPILLIFLIVSAVFAQCMGIELYTLPGRCTFISAKGEELWCINRNRRVFRFDFNQGQWNQISAGSSDGVAGYGEPSTISASPDGWAFISTTGNAAFRFNPGTTKWELCLNSVPSFQVSAISKDSEGTVGGGYLGWINSLPFPGSDYKATTAGKPIDWVSYGQDNSTWIIEKTSKRIFSSNKIVNVVADWVPVAGVAALRNPYEAKGVAASLDVQDAKRVVMTTETGRVYMWTGDDWTRLPVDNAAQATIGSSRVFILDETERVIMGNL